jgi:hypothetical protein
MRVLEGRRSRLEERLEKMRASLARTRERLDDYTLELQRHGMESVEREVRWLNELIESERVGRDVKGSASEGAPQGVSEGSSLGASEGSAQQNSTSGETGGLPRHRDQSRPDPSDDTTT